MNKVRAWIVTDSTAANLQSGPLNIDTPDLRDSDIDGSTRHVEAASGNTLCCFAQHVVGFFRAESGEHQHWLFSVNPLFQQIQNIKQPRIDRFDFTGSEITHQPVDLVQSAFEVVTVRPEDYFFSFASVCIVQIQRPVRVYELRAAACGGPWKTQPGGTAKSECAARQTIF